MLNSTCRVCGRYTACKNSLRIFDNKNVLWSIQVLTGLILENAKCLPDLICICCQTELREAIGFSDRVIATQQQLLAALSEDELQDVSEEYRVAVMEFAGNSSQKSNNTSNSETFSELGAEIIKIQPEAEEIVIEEYGIQEEPLEYEIIIDDEPIPQETHAQNIRLFETIEDATDKPQSGLSEVNEHAIADDIVLPSVKESEKEFVVPSDATAVKKKRGRKRIGNVTYHCEVCGNHVSGRMAFELHCRRHRGEKQYECSICQDRFCTSSELKSHMRRHTGERPFACHYCERSFADYSTRVKHERTHTNERPYACTSCGKAFTTAYILKNHMLIHSGERAFSCESCNKTFRRHTHLVTHCRSRAHRRKLERQHKEIIVK